MGRLCMIYKDETHNLTLLDITFFFFYYLTKVYKYTLGSLELQYEGKGNTTSYAWQLIFSGQKNVSNA